MYRIYKDDGEIEVHKDVEPLDLEGMQSIVDGYIEVIGDIYVQGIRYSFIANEEALFRSDLDWNPNFPGIRGNVLFCVMK